MTDQRTDKPDNEGAKMEQVLPVGDSVLVVPAPVGAYPEGEQVEHRMAADVPVMARLSTADSARLAYRIQRLQKILRDRPFGE